MVLVYMQNVRNFKALLLRVCPVGMGVVLEVVILVMARTTIVIKYRARCSGICVQPQHFGHKRNESLRVQGQP